MSVKATSAYKLENQLLGFLVTDNFNEILLLNSQIKNTNVFIMLFVLLGNESNHKTLNS